MSEESRFIETMVSATGLPSEIWPNRQATLGGGAQRIESRGWLPILHQHHRNPDREVLVPDSIVRNVSRVTAAHVLGQAVLFRPSEDVTTLVTVAEAALVAWGKHRAEMLWMLLQAIEGQLIASSSGRRNDGILSFTWLEEITFEEHLRNEEQEFRDQVQDTREKREYRSSSSETTLKKILLEQKTLQMRITNIQNQHQSIIKSLQEQVRLLRSIAEKLEPTNEQYDQQLTDVRRQEQSIPQSLQEQGRFLSSIAMNSGTTKDSARIESPFMRFPAANTDQTSEHYKRTSRHINTYHKDERLILQANNEWFHEVQELLHWLAVAVGASRNENLAACPTFSTLEKENETKMDEELRLAKEQTSESYPESGYSQRSKNALGCWRQKIQSGNVLILDPYKALGTPFDQFELTATSTTLTQDILKDYPDPLVLTAAALWSLFDNRLLRVSGCMCTFQCDNGYSIQCKQKRLKWLIWHVSKNKSSCDGTSCDANVRIALTKEQDGEKMNTTTPCILGWEVVGRPTPTSPLWEKHVTSSFSGKNLFQYTLKEFQVFAQLSAPTIINPKIGCAATFSKENYGIEGSIDCESLQALESAQVAPVLIFDEKRDIHLLCDGAEVVEILCLQYLYTRGLSETHLPEFSHGTSLGRLRTWYQSVFISHLGTRIPGDEIVRNASKRLAQLVAATQKAAHESEMFLYWIMSDVIRGGKVRARKVPLKRVENSWCLLARECPPVILAVGEINMKRLVKENFPSTLTTSNDTSAGFRKKFLGNSKCPSMIANLSRLGRWLYQTKHLRKMSLSQSQTRFKFGVEDNDEEFAYEIVELDCISRDDLSQDLISSCGNCGDKKKDSCVHYVI